MQNRLNVQQTEMGIIPQCSDYGTDAHAVSVPAVFVPVSRHMGSRSYGKTYPVL